MHFGLAISTIALHAIHQTRMARRKMEDDANEQRDSATVNQLQPVSEAIDLISSAPTSRRRLRTPSVAFPVLLTSHCVAQKVP